MCGIGWRLTTEDRLVFFGDGTGMGVPVKSGCPEILCPIGEKGISGETDSRRQEKLASMENPIWIGVDWGTTNLRVWGMSQDSTVLSEVNTDQGMNGLDSEDFEPTLLTNIESWLPEAGHVPVIVCGMAGAKSGWETSPYREVPCLPLSAEDSVRPQTFDRRLSVRILPGVSQTRPAHDVMRGEETQIAGFLSECPGFDGVVCLPGTHTKWVHLSAGEIVSFRTFMTGELFGLLQRFSVLRDILDRSDWDEAEFISSVEAQISRPEALAARMFTARAEALISGLEPAKATGRLSGALIGAELAAARTYWLGRDLVLIGPDRLVGAYSRALAVVGQSPRVETAARLTVLGLTAAFAMFQGSGFRR